MRRTAQMASIMIVGVFVLVLSAGCQEAATPSEKKARLIAAENRQLMKDLAGRDKDVEQLKQQHAREIEQLEKKLDGAKEQVEVWKNRANKEVKQGVDAVAATVMAENERLRQENEQLKAEIEKLKAEPGKGSSEER